MLKDDRMMGVLTFVVILVAAGTMVQRADFFKRFFEPQAPAALNADAVEAEATEPARLDVLANDANVTDAGRLAIARPPDCGRASVREGAIEYLGTMECVGEQTLHYGLGEDGQTAEVRIAVRAPESVDGRPRTIVRPGMPDQHIGAAPAEATESAGAESAGAESAGAESAGAESAGAEVASAGATGEAGSADPERADPERSADAAPDSGEPEVSAMALNRAGGDASGATRDGAAGSSAGSSAGASTNSSGGAPGAERPGARPGPADGICATPPTITLNVGPGAVTGVEIDSRCHAVSVAELTYDGLQLAIRLDGRGRGRLAVPGFQRSTEAAIAFRDGEAMDFNLPFDGIERIERVAVAWQAPGGLALNAFEFGARPGAAGHLTPAASRDFEDVRRAGGGWLDSYQPVAGKGQRVDVYSFWRRHDGPSGVVRLALDPGEGTGACGAETAADYVVLRSAGGAFERARLGRIAPFDCTVLAGGSRRYIENAVDDLIVRRR